VVVLTKADLLAPEARTDAAARAGLPRARLVSAHTGEGVRELLESLWTLISAPARVAAADGDAG
jgi:50S ribosomal subunit-associated GTPase HflX